MTGMTPVLIGTPAYGGMIYWGQIQSVMQYLEADIPVAISGIGNESLIPRARDTILSNFTTVAGSAICCSWTATSACRRGDSNGCSFRVSTLWVWPWR